MAPGSSRRVELHQRISGAVKNATTKKKKKIRNFIKTKRAQVTLLKQVERMQEIKVSLYADELIVKAIKRKEHERNYVVSYLFRFVERLR